MCSLCFQAKDKHGISALLAAIWEGHTHCVKLLLEQVNQRRFIGFTYRIVPRQISCVCVCVDCPSEHMSYFGWDFHIYLQGVTIKLLN
jgi:ankyrin repeat protein